MNWKTFMLGAAAGAVGAYAVNAAIVQNRDVPAQRVLAHARTQFKQSGPVVGSWIHMKSEPFEKNTIQYQVYRGGITRQAAGQDGPGEQYEFIADAATGTILEAYKL